jgi:AbrB family looped-hinge helix DNA binding protein
MGYFAKVTSKGQITIPKRVRDSLGLDKGSTVIVIERDGEAILRPKTGRAIDLAGFLGKPPSGMSLKIEDFDDAIGEAIVEEFERSTRR